MILNRFLILLIALTLGLSVNAQRSNARNRKSNVSVSAKSSKVKGPCIQFDTKQHNFGKVKIGQSKTFVYKFKNTGNANLVVVSSNVYCNCMHVTIPKDPIAPGMSGKIVMKFTGEDLGSFMKNAQIYTNCESPMVRLEIEGEVIQ